MAASATLATTTTTPLVAIVGNPNVGKSVLFNRLTGKYVTVSNYPGTTVELSEGTAKIGDLRVRIVDTPGMYSICPITEEERVARELLITRNPDLLLHVVDAKNLKRMLPLTLQLVESGFPVVLVINMMDEAERIGVLIDSELLEKELGIPVVATACLHSRGIDTLRDVMYARVGK